MNQRHLFQNILYNVFSCRCWGSKRYSTSMFNWDLARCRPKTLSQLKTQFVSCNMGLCKLGLPRLHESLDLWIKAGFQEIQEIWRSSMKKSKFPWESWPLLCKYQTPLVLTPHEIPRILRVVWICYGQFHRNFWLSNLWFEQTNEIPPLQVLLPFTPKVFWPKKCHPFFFGCKAS